MRRRVPGAATFYGRMRGPTLLLHHNSEATHSKKASSEAPFTCGRLPTSHQSSARCYLLTGYSSPSSLENSLLFDGSQYSEEERKMQGGAWQLRKFLFRYGSNDVQTYMIILHLWRSEYRKIYLYCTSMSHPEFWGSVFYPEE